MIECNFFLRFGHCPDEAVKVKSSFTLEHWWGAIPHHSQIWFQIPTAKGHSYNMWFVDSIPDIQAVHNEDWTWTPCWDKAADVGIRSHLAHYMKQLTLVGTHLLHWKTPSGTIWPALSILPLKVATLNCPSVTKSDSQHVPPWSLRITYLPAIFKLSSVLLHLSMFFHTPHKYLDDVL